MKKVHAVLLMAICLTTVTAFAAKVEVKYDAHQKQAVEAIEKQGGLVLRIAQDSDAHRVDYHLQGKGLTDGGLQHLAKLPNLVDLNIAGTKVTDNGLKAIGAIKSLERLNLNNTKVTDAGLAHIKGLTKLTYLNLYGCEGVTDKGLQQLAGLSNLKALYLWKTKVTKDGAKKFADANKSVRINTGWDLSPVVAKPADVKTVAAKPAAPKHVNSKCPITGRNVDPSKTFTYKGEIIALCCNNCLNKFKAAPAKFIGKVNRDLKPAAKLPTISEAMKKAHKGGTLKKVLTNKGNKDDLKQLIVFYEAMTKQKPPKGDLNAWKKQTGDILAALQKLEKGDKKQIDAIQKMTNCKACHGKFKG